MLSFDELLNIPGMIFVGIVSIYWLYYNFFHVSEKSFLNAFGYEKSVNKAFSLGLLLISVLAWLMICLAVAKPIKYIGASQNKKDVRDIENQLRLLESKTKSLAKHRTDLEKFEYDEM